MSFLYGLCARHQHSAATAHEQHALLATENFAHTFRRARTGPPRCARTATRPACQTTSLALSLAQQRGRACRSIRHPEPGRSIQQTGSMTAHFVVAAAAAATMSQSGAASRDGAAAACM